MLSKTVTLPRYLLAGGGFVGRAVGLVVHALEEQLWGKGGGGRVIRARKEERRFGFLQQNRSGVRRDDTNPTGKQIRWQTNAMMRNIRNASRE